MTQAQTQIQELKGNEEKTARVLQLSRCETIQVPAQGNTSLVAPEGDLAITFGEGDGQITVKHLGPPTPVDNALLEIIDSLPPDQDFEVNSDGNGGYDVVPVSYGGGLRLHQDAA